MSITLSIGLASQIHTSGISVLVANTNMGSAGGLIINPLKGVDQGLITYTEPLFVSFVGPAALKQTATTTKLLPGQSIISPPNTNVWVNAVSAGHKFTSIFSSDYVVPFPPIVVPGQSGSQLPGPGGMPPFPPWTVTGLTRVVPSYLYQEYSDDDDLQGFVAAQNSMQQDYVDTFNALGLPIYTGNGSLVSNRLLDWVGQGVYGMARPALETGQPDIIGPLNTWGPNWITTDTLWQGSYIVASNKPDLSKITPISIDQFWTAVTANPNQPDALTVTLPGIPAGTLIYNNDVLRYFPSIQQWGIDARSHLGIRFGLNEIVFTGLEDVVITNDDIYRRILSWHFFKSDGKYFSVRWLKRRVWRFCYGYDGISPDFAFDPLLKKGHQGEHGSYADTDDKFIADTRQISVTFGPFDYRTCAIRFVLYDRPVTGGAMCNMFGCNGFEPQIHKHPPWDIGTDQTPSGGGVNYQLNSYVNHGTGNSSNTTTLTITGTGSGPHDGYITPGCSIIGNYVGLPQNTTIVRQLTTTDPGNLDGRNGTYQTSAATNLSNATLSFGTNTWADIGGGGAIAAPGGIYLNDVETTFVRYDPLPFMNEFQMCVAMGIVELPYQFTFSVHIG